MTAPPPTPSQTVGPYFAVALTWEDGPFAVSPGVPGAIRLAGRVLDGAGVPVRDALVETWQADPPAGPGFRGFARCPTDDDGAFAVVTLLPGPVPGPGGTTQAPHVDVGVLARGLLRRVVTRAYFAEHAALHAADPVLARVPDARRATLLASAQADGTHRFDVRLQGEGETVFFAL